MNNCILVFFEYGGVFVRLQQSKNSFFQFNGYGDKTPFEIANGQLNLEKHVRLSGEVLGVWNDDSRD